MVMMLVMALYTVVDGIFVSRLINTDAFSAVNIVYPLPSLIVALGTMFGTGTAAIVSRKLGEGRGKEANAVLTFIIIITALIGIVCSAVCLPFLKDIIRLLGADESVAGYCYDYAFPLVFFFPASILQLQFQCLFAANSKPYLGLITTLSGGIANVLLDWLFIGGLNMGIAGAAVATGIGYCIPAVFGIFYFAFFRKNSLFFVKPKAAFKEFFQAMGNGSSEMVSNVSTSVTTLLFNLIMMRLVGSDGVAAIAVILYMDFVLVALNLGYSIGVAPVISYNYGRMDKEKSHKVFKISLIMSVVSGAAVAALTLFAAPVITAAFVEKGNSVYELAVSGLRIFSVCYLFKGFNIFGSAMFTAYSNGIISALISLCRSFIFLVAFLFGLSAAFGITGVWVAVPAGEALTFIVTAVCFGIFASKYGYGTKKDKEGSIKIS